MLSFLRVAGTATLAWAIWALWPSPRDEARAAAAANAHLSKGMVIGLVLAASMP